jgi:hypothetical protein
VVDVLALVVPGELDGPVRKVTAVEQLDPIPPVGVALLRGRGRCQGQRRHHEHGAPAEKADGIAHVGSDSEQSGSYR